MNSPLQGLKVLDFTHGVAGPYSTMVLGDLGCDVIKIEKPKRGDPTRYMNVAERFASEIPLVGGDYFLAINRNKRSVAIDMKEPEGRDLCRALAREADIAVQNFRPGVMKRLGLDFAALQPVNPRLIYANISAYGDTGPLASKPGMDVAVQARSGVMRITGEQGSTTPLRPGASLADFGGGIYLSTAILAALYAREKNGKGAEVSVSLLDATMSLLINYSIATMDGGADLGPMGSGHPQLVPYQAFPTSDGFLVISAGTNKIYRELCHAIGCPELGSDPRFLTNQDRVRHRVALVDLISAVTAKRGTAEWLAVLEAKDIPCAPVNTLKQAYAELQRNSPNMVREVPHPSLGKLHLLGSPFQFGGEQGEIRLPPPRLGEHTAEVLGKFVDSKTLAQLAERGIVGRDA